MCDDLADMRRQLSVQPDLSPAGRSRRRFLQYTAAGTAIAGLGLAAPGRASALASSATSPVDGVLVVIQLSGGNDGLNTVAPVEDGSYHSLRRGAALDPEQALPLGEGLALHPSLTGLKARYDRGEVAVIRGIGHADANLSHFDSMAFWQGGAADIRAGHRLRDGWLGRYLDGLGAGTAGVEGVVFDTAVPLHLVGRRARAVALPTGGVLTFGSRIPSHEASLNDALRTMGAGERTLGPWADQLARMNVTAIDEADRLVPAYPGDELVGSRFEVELAQAARLINADVGVRVLSVTLGGFDTHEGLAWSHARLMDRLDAGIERFYAELDGVMAPRVALMTFSEFGRRVVPNGSHGTDHGAASVAFVIGSRVKGGLYGEQPSLSNLDGRGNLRPQVDFRSMYATVLDRWLRADAREVLRGEFEQFDLFGSDPDRTTIVGPAPSPLARHGYLMVTDAGGVHNFGRCANFGSPWTPGAVAVRRHPSGDGYWVAGRDGGVFSYGDAGYFGSMGGRPLSRPVIDMAAAPDGEGYWLVGEDGGVFSFGSAGFHGSTGNLSLVEPVVGMAAHPDGRGYWFCARDGGVFAYGSAGFHGSAGHIRLNRPVVGMTAHPSGRGYWLVCDDGGVFAFGVAGFHGSTGAMRLAEPIVGMATTPSGRGYWLVARDGGVFAFGDATFQGSLGAVAQTGDVRGIAA